MKHKEAFVVCDRCSASIANDDWTWLDMYADTPEESLEMHARHTASVEAMGIVGMAAKAEGGYIRCFVCGMDEMGGYVWEQVMT